MTELRRYKAFISYSHADSAHASWLQRALERYRTPTALRRAHPDLPVRLYPVFRDSDELASSTDLSESIQRAMDDSDALVVICSPAARASRWVNEEIRRFRAIGRGDRIFCLIVAGSPDRASRDCAFPDALLCDDEGRALREPLAADLTAAGDGKRNAMLKIAAGLLRVGVDELKRRDAQRQARSWSLVAAGSLLVTAITAGLALYAVHARRDAEVRRAQAENLIGFMLGDLRSNLEQIGKLELLDSIGNQAMAYFAAIGAQGTEKELLERARALKQIGDVRFNRGQLEPALLAFSEALVQTRALHDADPGNNDYLFELGQAEFWVGYVAWQRGDFDGAYQAMQRYLEYSRELSRRAPDNDGYWLELSYAYGNLASVALAQGRPQVALEGFRDSLALAESLLARGPRDYDLALNAADTHSWVGTTLIELGRLAEARDAFAKAAAVVYPFHQQGHDQRASYNYVRLLTLQANADILRGDLSNARRALEEVLAVYGNLLKIDPTNIIWLLNALRAETYLLSLVPPGQWTAQERAALERIQSRLAGSSSADASDKDLIALQFRVRGLHDNVLLHQGDAAAALRAAQQTRLEWQAATEGKAMAGEFSLIAARLEQTLGRALAGAGHVADARATWQAEAARLDAMPTANLSLLAVRRLLAIDLGDLELANDIGARLEAAGYRDPRTDPAHTMPGASR
jgi:eukaryotic-like serine/threonine-protein kinase